MGKFDDPKRADTYKERNAVGKMAKSGKLYDLAALREIGSEQEFLAFIGDIGFEWLLKHSTAEVPVALAKEFFSTFHVKPPTDLDTDSITFRLFNEEYEMSIREWSLWMGLFTHAEDEDGIWNERVVGAPKYTLGFKPQTAWEFITHKRVGTFKTTQSKGFHITNHILRFAQVFIGYNLMGMASSAITTAELYFAWCMAKRIKVHLGYWLAQACHQMTANPARHMYTCHLLGAYLQRNVIMKIRKVAPEVLICEPPELFGMECFFNKGLLYMDGLEVCFYDVGTMGAQVKKELDGIEAVVSADVEELKKEMTAMREELGGIRVEMQALTGRITDLVGKSSAQSDRMAEAVKIKMRLADWLEMKFPRTQQRLPPGPGSTARQPGQGSSSLQRSPSTSKPVVNPSVSRPLALVSVKKPISKQPVYEEEEPESLARKKVKTNCPSVPPKSGSRGGQTQN